MHSVTHSLTHTHTRHASVKSPVPVGKSESNQICAFNWLSNCPAINSNFQFHALCEKRAHTGQKSVKRLPECVIGSLEGRMLALKIGSNCLHFVVRQQSKPNKQTPGHRWMALFAQMDPHCLVWDAWAGSDWQKAFSVIFASFLLCRVERKRSTKKTFLPM